MKRSGFLLALLLLPSGFLLGQQATNAASSATAASDSLAAIIEAVEEFQPEGFERYPLGNFQKGRYLAEAAFAKEQLARPEQLMAKQDQGYEGQGTAGQNVPSGLSESEQISAELLRFRLQNEVDEVSFETYLNPLQADQGFHLNLNYRIRPINNIHQARYYLKVLNDIPRFVEEHLVLLREGIGKGWTQPRVIFKGYESTYDTHLVNDYTQSPFYEPFRNLRGVSENSTQGLSQGQRDSVLQAARLAIEDSVIPSFRKIKAFFEKEYLPAARERIGISALPWGSEYYQNRIDYYTTTTGKYTAEDIHKIGLKEVARIRSRMQEVMAAAGFEGDFPEFLEYLRTSPEFYAETPEMLLMTARDISKRIDAQLPRFFKLLPRRPYGVRKVPDALAPKYTGGRYSPPAAETAPGYYLVNTYKLESRPLYVLPSLTAHEAVPGHHLQMSLNSELEDNIPNFRKWMYLSAYGEGWALYTEYLAAEMGIYTTPYEEFGQLTYEMWRACRLVVDTGIHALGWSREQVVDYMLSNTALSEHEVGTETDRYIAWPGQALSYKMGELVIRELRAQAETSLGEVFDIREFHNVILEEGTVTLPILRRRVEAYIAAALAENESE